jgi:DNA-binding NarL/FixJ family response regulator
MISLSPRVRVEPPGPALTAEATLLLVDDHPLFHAGLASMLRTARPGWRLLSAHDAAQGLEMIRADDGIDLVLVDIVLPGIDGFDALAEFGKACPQLPRVTISGREDAAARLRARHCGASGFISKAWAPERIAAVLDAVLDGGSGFDDGAAQAPGHGEDGDAANLTPRQVEVLSLLAEGHSNKEIEYRLSIAERTVRAHLTEIFQALGAQTRVQAILQAQKLGLIP